MTPLRSFLAMLVLVAAVVVAPVAVAPVAVADTTPTRASGITRIGTAVDLSQRTFGAGAPAAVLASATAYADALAATPLAAAVGGPLLLTERDALDDAVRAELRRLDVATVHVMGGANTLAPSIDDSLRGEGYTVERYPGADRFETAALAADAVIGAWQDAGDESAGDEAVVALGEHPVESRAWPDALVSGVLAGHAHRPILLVAPDRVPDATAAWFSRVDPGRVTVAGGPSSIPDNVMADLGDGDTVRVRRGGVDRYGTAVLLAADAVAAGADPAIVTVATGLAFPDALAAAAATVARGGVMLLLDGTDLDRSTSTRAWLRDRRGAVNDLLVAGGPATVTPPVVDQVVRETDGFVAPTLKLTQVAVPFGGSILGAMTAPGDGRLHAFTRQGEVWALGGGGWVQVLDLGGRVNTSGEGGLLGLAFPADHGTSGRFFAHYTGSRSGGLETRIVEYVRQGTAEATGATERRLLTIAQPASNHNGGTLLIAPDQTLLAFLGDGGGSGDPQGNGQDPSTPLGAVLRIDVSAPGFAGVPADNPAAGSTGDGRFVWMYGLRNPFRADLDPATGLLHIADVGQNAWEEVDVVAWTAKSTNFGWNVMEGTHCYNASSCDTDGLTMPVAEYSHDDGCSITGGVVYRGSIGMLRGHYFYGDFCSGLVRSLRVVDGQVVEEHDWTASLGGDGIWSFGRDAAGEVYVSKGSALYRVDLA